MEKTNRELLIEWNYDQSVVDAMSDEECKSEVEALGMYPEAE